MTYIIDDRVKQSCDIVGLSPITLTDPIIGYKTFSETCDVGDTFHYVAVHTLLGQWEAGLGTLISENTISRTVIQSSSNSNQIVTFPVGPKEIFISLLAKNVVSINDQDQIDFKNLSAVNVKVPIQPTDLVTKGYVDTATDGKLPIKTFNIIGTANAPLRGTAIFRPINPATIKRINLSNSSLVANTPLTVGLYIDDALSDTYSIAPGNYTASYTDLNIPITTSSNIRVDLISGTGFNFTMTLL